MCASPRIRLVAIVASAVATLALLHAPTSAQPTPTQNPEAAKPAPGAAGGAPVEVVVAEDELELKGPLMSDHLALPLTVKGVKTWLRLQEPVTMSFAAETPLDDVLKYIKSATHHDGEKDLKLYVDPVALQEEEKTLSSPVVLDLEDVPLAKSLELLLKQLGLAYIVDGDGIVNVTGASSEDTPRDVRPYIAALREDAARLRGAVAGLRGRPLPAGMGAPGMMGGMGGGFR